MAGDAYGALAAQGQARGCCCARARLHAYEGAQLRAVVAYCCLSVRAWRGLSAEVPRQRQRAFGWVPRKE